MVESFGKLVSRGRGGGALVVRLRGETVVDLCTGWADRAHTQAWQPRTLALSFSTTKGVASTVIHGLHGRRRAGPGENFWQYRHFTNGEPSSNVDWRRSARDDHLYVREREWEASHTIWLWADRSPSMDFSSNLTEWTKLDRALVVSFALAEVLVQGGERVVTLLSGEQLPRIC